MIFIIKQFLNVVICEVGLLILRLVVKHFFNLVELIERDLKLKKRVLKIRKFNWTRWNFGHIKFWKKKISALSIFQIMFVGNFSFFNKQKISFYQIIYFNFNNQFVKTTFENHLLLNL